MKTRRNLVLCLLAATLMLTGCLFTVNHPVVLPDGSLAVFLGEDGGYMLFPEEATLHISLGAEWLAVPSATLASGGGLLDRSPDGSELLYADVDMADPFGPIVTTLFRVKAEPGARADVLWETEQSLVRAVWMEDDRILLLLSGDEDIGTLVSLSPEEGTFEIVQRDVLSFVADRESGRIDALRIDQDGDLVAGFVERSSPDVFGGRDQAVFHLSEQTLELYLLLPHKLLWDVSADGRWIALSLFDPTIIEPEMDQEVPTLYLIDTEADEVTRLPGEALAPAFSPDGRWLAYLTSNDGETSLARIRDLEVMGARDVAGGRGATSIVWLGIDRLGLVFEDDEDRASLIEVNVRTGERHVLLGSEEAPVE